ncbi:MAG: flagellar basal body P-ring formation chaperone FlgA [Siculibacillus sp.]
MKVLTADTAPTGLFCCAPGVAARLVRSVVGAAAVAALACGILSVLGTAAAVGAERRVAKLRASVAVTSELVTIGDFFEDAGRLAGVALFRAPDLGTTGAVPARRVADLARVAGLAEIDTVGLVEVSVSRLGRPIEAAELSRLVATEILRRPGRADDVSIDDLEITFDAPVEPRQADLNTITPVRVVSLNLAPQSGRFEALIQIDKGETNERIRLRGTVVETVSIAVLTRALARGDLVAPEDVQIDRQPRARVGALRSLADPREIVGHQARRSLRAGQPVSIGDFARPNVVGRGDTVTIVFRTGSLQVTGRGQALQAGAMGEMISVLNPQSKRTVHATVAGPGRVEISAASTTVAAVGPVASAAATRVNP